MKGHLLKSNVGSAICFFHNAYTAWTLLNVQMSKQTSLTVTLEQRKYIGLENCMFILFIKMVLKPIKEDLSALFTGETHSNPISIESQSLVHRLLIQA